MLNRHDKLVLGMIDRCGKYCLVTTVVISKIIFWAKINARPNESDKGVDFDLSLSQQQQHQQELKPSPKSTGLEILYYS